MGEDDDEGEKKCEGEKEGGCEEKKIPLEAGFFCSP